MSDINFLNNQKRSNDQKPKDNKEELAWSSPEKEIKNPKSSPFSFFPSFKKQNNKSSIPAPDKNKIKQSREEILGLIKHHENSKPLVKENKKSFFSTLGEKFKKKPAPKEILIDYQKVFKREKEHKNQIGQLNLKPVENKVASSSVKSENNFLNQFNNLFKDKKNSAIEQKKEQPKIVEPVKVEEVKSAEIKKAELVQPVAKKEESKPETKEIKIEKLEEVKQDETKYRVLETNLIKGELVTFFDWRSKIFVSISAILLPLFVVGIFYYGLVFYQKSQQAKNLAQIKKFAELEQDIKKEEASLKEIIDFQAKLKTVSQIFSQHIYWTNFFKFLEDNTIKDVYFVNFEGDTSGNYAMDAITTNYSSIAEQVNTFKKNAKISAVLAEGGEMIAGNEKNKSLVKFILNFSIAKNIFIE
ncbi:MAG: hypothetical protein WC349_05230 [Patescibacteria group bacterium]|jgi:hypothetical protein